MLSVRAPSRTAPALAGLAAAALAAIAAPAPARAQGPAPSLRCNGQLAVIGESKLSLLRKCGEPALKDAFCKPYGQVVGPNGVPLAAPPFALPCEWVEEWSYDRGAGQFIQIVRFADGVVASIRDGERLR